MEAIKFNQLVYDTTEFFNQTGLILGIKPDTQPADMLKRIKQLIVNKGETEIEEALNLDILTVAEAQLYAKMFRSGQTNVLQIITEKRQDFDRKQEKEKQDLFDKNSDKILTHLTAAGWNEVKKLGYESVKQIVDCFPERIYLSKMVNNSSGIHDLDWYRKNNPKELQNNPELYNTLLKNYKSNK